MEHHFWIRVAGGQVQPIRKLKKAQLKLLALYFWCKQHNLPVRIVILKARKEGLSTLVQALLQIETYDRGLMSVVIAHDKESTQDIFGIGERMYLKYDLKKPELQRSNIKELKFKDDKGHIKVLTAGNILAGTGLTPQFLHCSETAKWKKGSETATALLQSVADIPETAIIIECTAYGFDGLFKPMWDDAYDSVNVSWTTNGDTPIPDVDIHDRERWNGYIPLFIPWFEDEQYDRPFHSDEDESWFMTSLDHYEKHLIEDYNCTPTQVHSYRWLLKSKCQKDDRIRKQEYPSNPLEAFVHSGSPRFSVEILDEMPITDPRRGTLVYAARMSRQIDFLLDGGGFFYIWDDPIPGHKYVFGLDTAEGKLPEGCRDPDATVGIVIDVTAGGKQAAKLYGQIDERHTIDYACILMEWYNGAYGIIENNASGKYVAERVSDKYPKERLYHQDDWSKKRRRMSRAIGFRSHAGTRDPAIAHLSTIIDSRGIILQDEKSIAECRSFKRTEGGRAEATPGYHDDHVSALWLCAVGMTNYPATLKPHSSLKSAISNAPPTSYRYVRRGGGRPKGSAAY